MRALIPFAGMGCVGQFLAEHFLCLDHLEHRSSVERGIGDVALDGLLNLLDLDLQQRSIMNPAQYRPKLILVHVSAT
jgi:hypothetical protein